MCEIKSLNKITYDELMSFGLIGFTSKEKYDVTIEESEDAISFHLKLTGHPGFRVGVNYNDENELDKYNKLIHDGNSFGAYEGNKLIGFIVAEKHEWNNSLWVEMIRVAKEYKRTGIGTRLLSALEQHAGKLKVRIIDIETQNTNIPAIKFYRKNGYEFAGLNMTLYDPEECGDEIAVFMAKSIE